jgi:hypothetical protein
MPVLRAASAEIQVGFSRVCVRWKSSERSYTMQKRTIAAAIGLAFASAVAVGGVALANGGGDSNGTVSGPNADKATTAALKATGGGTANSVERDGENGATWEVEVTRTDGTTVDVRLDENLGVVVIEGDSEPATQ